MITDIDDREAVELARRGDRRGLSALHQWYAPLLHRQAVSALRNPRAAEDAVRTTFLTAGQRLDRLADPARVRGWLMAACARQALDVLRARRPDDRSDPSTGGRGGPRDAALADERLQILLDTARRLPPEDRVVIRLHLQGLRVEDLAAALDRVPARAYVRFHRARGRLGRAIGARLLGRRAPGACGDLERLLDAWDGTFTTRSRGTVVQHLDRCEECVERRMRLTDPEELLGVLALLGRSSSEEPDDADIDIEDEDPDVGVEHVLGGGGAGGRGASAPRIPGRRWGGVPGGTVAVGGAAVVAIVAGGALLPQVWADDVDRSVAVSSAAGPAVRTTPPPSSATLPSEAPTGLPTVAPTTDTAERPPPEPEPDRDEPDPRPATDGERGTPTTTATSDRPTAAPAPPPDRPTTALDPLVGPWQDFGGFAMVVEEDGTGRLTAAPAGNGCGWAAGNPLFRGITPTGSGFTGERYLGPCVASPADWVPVTITVEERRALTESTSFLGSLTWSAG